MIIVRQSVPVETDVDLAALLDRLRDPVSRLTPFSEVILDFCAHLSTALFRDQEARQFPELQALAFWMRKSELIRMKQQFVALEIGAILLMPRGLVFHIPPSNVDTIFVYSWMLSVLAGNANIIRLSERSANASLVICRLFNQVAASSDPLVAQSTAMLRYGHDREITTAISAATDVRVIWGGDSTVNTIRAIPLPAHAQELTFPDRYSLAVAKASAYLALETDERTKLAARFYNDTFWFHQMACSSPRVLIWTGSKSGCERASAAFYENLERELERKAYSLATGPRLNKLTFAYRAILDLPVSAYRQAGTECAVLELDEIAHLDRQHCGGGLLFQSHVEGLADLAPIIMRRDQTLTHFGFDAKELTNFARSVKGRGIDRFIPMGEALNFNRFWDGYDLLRAFTRTVFIQA